MNDTDEEILQILYKNRNVPSHGKTTNLQIYGQQQNSGTAYEESLQILRRCQHSITDCITNISDKREKIKIKKKCPLMTILCANIMSLSK